MLNSQAPLNLSVCSQRSDPSVSVKWQGEREDHSGAQHANEQTMLRKRKFKSRLLYSKQVASKPLWSWYKNESHLLPAMKLKTYFISSLTSAIFMRFYLQKGFVFPRSLVCNIFIHDTNYFICICASDLDLNLPESFGCGICHFICIHRQFSLSFKKVLELILFAQRSSNFKKALHRMGHAFLVKQSKLKSSRFEFPSLSAFSCEEKDFHLDVKDGNCTIRGRF